MKPRKRRFITFSGWISLIANALAIAGFLIDRWPLRFWQPNRGLWVVLSFVMSTYTLLIWSIWTWNRSSDSDGDRLAQKQGRAGVFLLNAMVTLPALTIWLYLVLAVLDDAALTITLRWILALAIAWAGTPFVAMGLTWTGATLGPLVIPRA